jgi:hypothetical protein
MAGPAPIMLSNHKDHHTRQACRELVEQFIAVSGQVASAI